MEIENLWNQFVVDTVRPLLYLIRFGSESHAGKNYKSCTRPNSHSMSAHRSPFISPVKSVADTHLHPSSLYESLGRK